MNVAITNHTSKEHLFVNALQRLVFMRLFNTSSAEHLLICALQSPNEVVVSLTAKSLRDMSQDSGPHMEQCVIPLCNVLFSTDQRIYLYAREALLNIEATLPDQNKALTEIKKFAIWD